MPYKSKYHKKVAILENSLKISELISYFNESPNNHFELGLVLNSRKELKGVINNVDIIKGITNISKKNLLVEEIMNTSPITIKNDLSPNEVIQEVKNKVSLRSKGVKNLTRYIPVINSKKQVINIIDIYELISLQTIKNENVEIYGLGFVGLSLAASLSNVGHNVTGIDINKGLIEQLNKGEISIHEPGLSDLIKNLKLSNKINFYDKPPSKRNNFFIVCVGTPIDSRGNANLKFIKSVLNIISKRIKKGDVVMLRSTVPVGTTRNIAKKILEEKSNLQAGVDFYLSFAPERTVEGKAMEELKTLPQIVGGLTFKCTEIAGKFWRTHSNVVVQTNSLESAELVKLANNSFRDLTFAFSNALVLLADKYNIDSNELIYLANEGYPRNSIARPSPGVGGYCLTKDPLLYAAIDKSSPHAKLSRLGREINQELAKYPIKKFKSFVKEENLNLSETNILIIGIAFKGWPETNDLRGSIGLEVAQELRMICKNVDLYDSIISIEEVESIGFKFKDIDSAESNNYDAVFIMNNHPKNIKKYFLRSLSKDNVFIFDGWNQIDKRTALGYKNIKYMNLGFYSGKVD